MTMRVIGCVLLLASLVLQACSKPVEVDGRLYEIRTYHAAPGKLNALETRFRDHTTKLFAKNDMENVAYWTQIADRQETPNPDRTLIYILSFPNAAAREKSWQAFGESAEWKKVEQESEKDGRLTTKIDSLLVGGIKNAPVIAPSTAGTAGTARVFELRTYKASDKTLPALKERLLGDLTKMFKKYGVELVAAWSPAIEEQGSKDTVICLLAHKSPEAANEAWKKICEDPEWIAAVTASEEKAKGPLTSADVKTILLQPTDFSPLK